MAGKILVSLTVFVTLLIAKAGYLGVFLLMGLSCACIPLPSEVVLLFSGSLAVGAQPQFNLWVVMVVSTVACVVGSAAAYWVGLVGGRRVMYQYGRYLLISAHDLERAERWFARYGDATVFFTRMLPIVRAFVSLPAGAARMPFWRFCLYTFLGSVPWCVGLAYAGACLGSHWDAVHGLLRKFDVLIVVVVAVVFVWWVWRHVRAGAGGTATAEGTDCTDETATASNRR